MPTAVELSGVRKTYGNHNAVDGIDLKVDEGEIFGIIGPNGAGKSTTVGIIAGLRTADAGTVSVLGRDPARQNHELRELVGIQLQEAQLPSLITVEEALRLYSSFYRDPVPWEPLLTEWNLEAKRKDRFTNLSGGQKQRLFICLALLSNPKLVILDELTTGLDPQARRESWELVSGVRERGATVILVTHFMDEAERLCDRIAVIDEGKVRAVGTVDDLLARNDDERELTFSVDASLDLAFIESLPQVTGLKRDGTTVTVRGSDYLMAAVAPALAERKVDPDDLAMRNQNLEDVFIRLTGEQVRD